MPQRRCRASSSSGASSSTSCRAAFTRSDTTGSGTGLLKTAKKTATSSPLQFCYARENTEKKATWRCVTELEGSETGPFERLFNSPLWHPSKRDQSNRAWVLLILATPADAAQPLRISSLSEALSELTEPADQAVDEAADHDAALPRCPHCGSCRTRLLGEYPPFRRAVTLTGR